MSFLSETHRQNKQQRIRRAGPSAEKLHQRSIKTLQGHMAAFYEHGHPSDINFLIEAFDRMERDARIARGNGQSSLIDSLLALLSDEPSTSPKSRGPDKRQPRHKKSHGGE